jgi:Protein of unknown function (DUF3102)
MSDLVTTAASADDLLIEIVKEHHAVESHIKEAVVHAFKVGELLIQAKTLVKRGEWQDWLADNCPFAETTAQAYMRLARLPEENRNALRFGTLRAAIESIAQHHERAIEDESKTIDGEAEEVEPGETDEADDVVEVLPPEDTEEEQASDDAGVEDGVIIEDEPGRSPEQKARDIAAVAINDVIQRCEFGHVDHLLTFQTLIKMLTEELRNAVVPLSAEESAEARKAAYAATESSEESLGEPDPKKKRGPPPKARPAEPDGLAAAAIWL